MTWHKWLWITRILYLGGGLCLLSGVSPLTMRRAVPADNARLRVEQIQ